MVVSKNENTQTEQRGKGYRKQRLKDTKKVKENGGNAD